MWRFILSAAVVVGLVGCSTPQTPSRASGDSSVSLTKAPPASPSGAASGASAVGSKASPSVASSVTSAPTTNTPPLSPPAALVPATNAPPVAQTSSVPRTTSAPASTPGKGGAAGNTASPASSSQSTASAGSVAPILYSPEHDQQIKAILALADQGYWEEAQKQAEDLFQADPESSTVQRVLSWVKQQGQIVRTRALEDRIREIDAKHSVFNPTVPRLVKEQKDRGLPPRKNLRDAVGQIEAAPYVPETFGKTIQQKGRMFDLESKQGKMQKILDKQISVHLDNVTLKDIIFNIGNTEGINFVADQSLAAFNKKLSVNFTKVPLSEFLKFVSRNLKVHFQVGDDLIMIVDAKNANKFQETRYYHLRNGFLLPAQFGTNEIQRTITHQKNGNVITQEHQKFDRFVQDGASMIPSIQQAIDDFFTGEYVIDYQRNMIVARGTPEQLDVLEKIIQKFDHPIQQVLIEARFVTVNQATFMELGAQWETGRNPLLSNRTAKDYTGLGTDVGLGLQQSFTGILGRKDLSVTLTALEQSGESQTLSAPRLTVLNNLPAKISDGKLQYYYKQYQVKQQVVDVSTSSSLVPAGNPTSITSGVELDVMASIGNDGKTIYLALNPQINQDVQLVTFATVTDRNDQGDVVSKFDIKLPQSRTQSVATRVAVQSGDTVVMGGVLQRTQSTFVESVPVLGSIPFLGALFRNRTETDNPRYLLIFVTATLLSDSGEFITYAKP